ncbi:hypothetical protein B0H14DRAFT_2567439 [Mycena olivaceomarginata]|nr:hypothetical protein B0H14DRAFT_2567439 [Mycena olivaceomarginata]
MTSHDKNTDLHRIMGPAFNDMKRCTRRSTPREIRQAQREVLRLFQAAESARKVRIVPSSSVPHDVLVSRPYSILPAANSAQNRDPTTDVDWSENEVGEGTFLLLVGASENGLDNVNKMSLKFPKKTRSQIRDCYAVLKEAGLIQPPHHVAHCVTALKNSRPGKRTINEPAKPVTCTNENDAETDADADGESDDDARCTK